MRSLGWFDDPDGVAGIAAITAPSQQQHAPAVLGERTQPVGAMADMAGLATR